MNTFDLKKKIVKWLKMIKIKMNKTRKSPKLKSKISFSKEFQFQEFWETCLYKKLKNKYSKDLIVSQSLCRLLPEQKKITEVTK